MKNLNLLGKTWSNLSREQQQELLSSTNCIDGVSGSNSKGGECIIDLTEELSVSGKLIIGEDEDTIQIDDNAIIYSSQA